MGVHDLVERDGCWALNGVLSGVEDHPNQVAERVLEQQMVIESKSSDPEEGRPQDRDVVMCPAIGCRRCLSNPGRPVE